MKDNTYTDSILGNVSEIESEDSFELMELEKKIKKLKGKNKKLKKDGKGKKNKKKRKKLEKELKELKKVVKEIECKAATSKSQQPWWQDAVTISVSKAFDLATVYVNNVTTKNNC